MSDSPADSPMKPALFLDRDGVLNEDRGYVSRWEDFQWIAGAREAIAAFNRAGWLVIVVTNQSGVGRGYYTEDDMHALHARMVEDLAAAGGRIDAFYHAPQHPRAKVEAYRHPDPPDRKPNPGMIIRALQEWPIDPDRSVLVGDKDSDMEAAKRAHIRGLRFPGGDLSAFLSDQKVLESDPEPQPVAPPSRFERLGWLLLPLLGAVAIFGSGQGWPDWTSNLAVGMAFLIMLPLMFLRLRRSWRSLF